MVHICRNVSSVAPSKRLVEAAAVLMAIHASEDRTDAFEKIGMV